MKNKKVVLITGASSGVGRETALRLASSGYTVSVCARRESRIKELVEEILSKGGEAIGTACDVTKWSQVNDFVKSVIDKFGKIDILINNAGAGIRFADFDKLKIEEIEEGIYVNLMGVLYFSRAVIPYMKRIKTGHIINISSILGKRSRRGLAVYTAAKHAVEGFSRALLNEVKDDGIRVSIIAPAMINTEWARKAGIENPFTSGKMIEPEDIAEIIEFIVKSPVHYCIWNLDLMPLSQTIDPL